MTQFKKLTVTTNDGVICLSGAMDDAMETYSLSESLRGKYSSLSFQSIRSASWNSLLRFDSLMRSTGAKSIKLRDLSFGIFRLMRMLDNFADFYELSDVEVPFIDLANKQVSLRKVNSQDVQKIKSEASGKLSFHGREQHYQALAPGFLEFGIWSSDRLSSVVYDYALYCETIFIFVSDLAEGVHGSANRVIEELKKQIGAIEKVARLLGLEIKDPGLFSAFQGRLLEIDQGVGAMAKVLGQQAQACQSSLSQLAAQLTNLPTEREAFTIESIKGLIDVVHSAKVIAAESEDFGVLVGELFKAYDFKSFEPQILDGIKALQSHEPIQQIIDAFCIMDPMADDKDVLVDAVKESLSLIDGIVGKISTISQSCDLMRQIIEHRINEATLLEGLVKSMGDGLIEPDSVSFFRSELVGLIQKKMVTDQEKFAMKFFMPQETKAAEASAQPGESLFF